MSEFIVSARKYRPVHFDEVVGQNHVAQTLKNALSSGKVAHAFLFCGPRGVGKTTCARIFAKVINCESPTKDWHACDACVSCKSYNENASFNITELDAASNNSVEHIRALVEQVRFQPQQGKYKVFIIDEVHMLSNQAFNAFLKTLEEPPPYAKFILATTEKHKIIPTILSRCQIYDFRRISVVDTALHLKSICEKEGLTADEDALHIIAQKADGALRDALSIFDRAVGFSGKHIRYDEVIENLNVLDYDYFFQITDALLSEDIATILSLFDQILRKGFDPDLFIVGLAEHIRNLLVCKDSNTLGLLETSDSLHDRYKKQAALTPMAFIVTALQLCNDCDINYKMARNKRLHVEMALVKMAYIQRAMEVSVFGAESEKKKSNLNPSLQPKPANPQPAAAASSAAVEVTPQAATIQVAPSAAPPITQPTAATTPPMVEEAPAPPLPKASIAQSEPSVPAAPAPLPATPIAAAAPSESRFMESRKPNAISLNMDDYMDQVRQEEDDPYQKVSRLSFDNLQKAWHAYKLSTDSPSLRNIMHTADLILKEKTLQVTTSSALAKDMLLQETRLFDALRTEVNDLDLKMHVKIDEEKAEEMRRQSEAKRPISTREKLDRMAEANPVLRELIRRFDLQLEE